MLDRALQGCTPTGVHGDTSDVAQSALHSDAAFVLDDAQIKDTPNGIFDASDVHGDANEAYVIGSGSGSGE